VVVPEPVHKTPKSLMWTITKRQRYRPDLVEQLRSIRMANTGSARITIQCETLIMRNELSDEVVVVEVA
jgi:hypothetical protein